MKDKIQPRFDDDDYNHLEPSKLKIAGTHGKPVKLYRYVGSTSCNEWNELKKYFYYITPQFVLGNGVTGFKDYGDIGWYCKHKDLFIIEQKLGVPLHLTIGYRERLNRTEAGFYYDNMRKQNLERKTAVEGIKGWFTEAIYPETVRDYMGDIVNSSRIYLPSTENFFEEGSVAFIIRSEQDFIGMFVNLEFSKNLGNCRGVLDGIFCYLDFDFDLADQINEWCYDETDEFRELFVRERDRYVYKFDPKIRCPKKKKSPCFKEEKRFGFR